jgi:hypothetical protein
MGNFTSYTAPEIDAVIFPDETSHDELKHHLHLTDEHVRAIDEFEPTAEGVDESDYTITITTINTSCALCGDEIDFSDPDDSWVNTPTQKFCSECSFKLNLPMMFWASRMVKDVGGSNNTVHYIGNDHYTDVMPMLTYPTTAADHNETDDESGDYDNYGNDNYDNYNNYGNDTYNNYDEDDEDDEDNYYSDHYTYQTTDPFVDYDHQIQQRVYRKLRMLDQCGDEDPYNPMHFTQEEFNYAHII